MLRYPPRASPALFLLLTRGEGEKKKNLSPPTEEKGEGGGFRLGKEKAIFPDLMRRTHLLWAAGVFSHSAVAFVGHYSWSPHRGHAVAGPRDRRRGNGGALRAAERSEAEADLVADVAAGTSRLDELVGARDDGPSYEARVPFGLVVVALGWPLLLSVFATFDLTDASLGDVASCARAVAVAVPAACALWWIAARSGDIDAGQQPSSDARAMRCACSVPLLPLRFTADEGLPRRVALLVAGAPRSQKALGLSYLCVASLWAHGASLREKEKPGVFLHTHTPVGQ